MASQIALQLFTLREFTKTPADIAKTFARVKKMGYDAVQCSALGKIDADELAKILKNEGLVCCATHISLDQMRDQTQKVIDDHKLWGCEYTAIGGFGWKDVDASGWHQFARDYSQIAMKFAGSGVSIGYHNHSHELVKYDGQTALDILIKETSRDVWFEIDTYWITHGGGDPIAWIEKVAGRVPCVHLKDMGITADKQQQMREIGEGNLNFAGIIPACKKAGTKWFIIEQDNCNGLDPFDCAERSLKNTRALGLV
jgi:sugar phosphate isomerase/epimerase